MRNMDSLDILFLSLLIIGGLNWGLIGLLNFDIVAAIFGNNSLLSRIVYTLVGVSALYTLAKLASRRTMFA
jgi:uncharacterized protein